MNIFKIKNLYLAMIAGALLILSWPPLPTSFLLFVALVPLFVIYEKLQDGTRPRSRFFAYVYLAMLMFNSGTTWWVWNASPSGCIMMLVLNSLLMSLPFWGYALVKKTMPNIAFAAFVCFYLGFEYFHFNWSASWPWMTFGKGFASMPWYIQWYEFTGEMGGSALILIVNVAISNLVIKKEYGKLWKPAALVVGMGLISVITRYTSTPATPALAPLECVISQPNIDPYTEKFGDGTGYLYPEIQLEYAIDAVIPHITDKTDLLLMPETAIVGWNNEAKLNEIDLLKPLTQINVSGKPYILAGAETYTVFEGKDRPTITARFDSSSMQWYDSYNTALLIDHGKVTNVYHKSRLVPGVEKMPFEFLEKLSISLGGTSGSLGTSPNAVNFTIGNGIKVAPLICYESVFGDYTNEFVNEGAQLLAVVTNDGWWGETPGYAQHLLFGAIRCIETRREMVRSANTGVSAKIDRYGHVAHQTKYNERIGFACQAQPYNDMTLYVRFGNIVGKFASLASIIILLMLVVKMFSGKKKEVM
jgi:apolipoprotein N-acyltransferase